MIDVAILSVIPPLVAAVLSYIVSTKKARIEHAKVLSDVQTHAIEQVRVAEEKMRSEIWAELQKVREENDELRNEIKQQGTQISNLERQLESSSQLRITLTQQVHTLSGLVETYKNRIIELEKKGN